MLGRLALAAAACAACAACGAPPAPQQPVAAQVAAPAPGSVPPALVAAPPPRPLDQDLPRLARRAVLMLQAISTALDAAGDDCAAATAKLAAVQQSFADVIAANALVMRADRKAELAAAMVPQQAALDAAGAAVIHAHTVAACVREPAFAAALDRALGAPDPGAP